ncbi:MAG: arylesterase [Tepidimonas sp.]|uniref:arylesterase n=1 Tax=Tepidimonas sp. TaxID=2002775 RepID=UPI004054B33C
MLAAAGLACLPLRAQADGPGSSPTVLVVGDSLSAEYGLTRGSGWVALLERRLQAQARRVRVVNASISGDTTAGGRSRLPLLLERHRPALVILELGGNDALRGLPLQTTRDNLRAMIRASRSAGAQVLLLGMDMPPNYGERYRADFRAVYTDLAREENVALVPFFLAGVADGPQAAALFQADRIHPNEQAQPRMLDNIWPALRPLLPRG